MGTSITKDHHLWTRDTIKNVSGDVTLDIAGDLKLDAGGQDIKFLTGGTSYLEWNAAGTLKMVNASDTGDYCQITVGLHGNTSIDTQDDDDGDAAHLKFNPEGNVVFSPNTGVAQFDNAADATLKVDATTSTTAGRDLTIAAGSTSTNGNNINGGDLILKSGGGDGTGTSIMTFSTKVSGTDTAAERMRIHTDGNVGIGVNDPDELLEVAGDVKVSGANKLYLYDSGGEYLSSDGTNITIASGGDILLIPSGNDVKITANQDGTEALNINNNSGTFTIKADKADASDIIFTNASDTEIFRIDGGATSLCNGAGGLSRLTLQTDVTLGSFRDMFITAGRNIDVDGTSGTRWEFDNLAVGFDKLAGTFGTSQEIGDSGDSTDIDFRLGNKYELELTGVISSILNLNLIFPATSGNFLLVIAQDGNGSRTVHADSWKVYNVSEALCANSAFADGTDGDIRWAGGSAPTLTTTADKCDIVSFYWDADNETCFATISQNF